MTPTPPAPPADPPDTIATDVAEYLAGEWPRLFADGLGDKVAGALLDAFDLTSRDDPVWMHWEESGAAITMSRDDRGRVVPVYHRPTLTTFGDARPGAVISDRAPQRVRYAFTIAGELTTFTGVIDQGDLFRALFRAGLIRKEER
jgi:hypothetical protein